MELAPCAFAVWDTAAALHSARRALVADIVAQHVARDNLLTNPNVNNLINLNTDAAWQDLEATVLAAYGVLRLGPTAALKTLAFSADVLTTLLSLSMHLKHTSDSVTNTVCQPSARIRLLICSAAGRPPTRCFSTSTTASWISKNVSAVLPYHRRYHSAES